MIRFPWRAPLVLFAVFCSGVLARPAYAQWILQSGTMNDQVKRGMQRMYNMEFASADSIFDSVIAENPGHPAGYFYRASVMFWRVVTNPDNTTFDADYKKWIGIALDRADSLLDKNPKDIAGLFYKGAALGMRARIYEYRVGPDDAMDIINLILGDAKKGVDYLDQLEEIIPNNSDVLFGRGVYNYYVEAEKQEDPALAPVISAMFPTGNKAAGLEMLEMAAAHAMYTSVEAKFELMHIDYALEHNYQRSYQLALDLASHYPNNVLFLHYLGFAAYTENHLDEYDSVYRVMLARSREKLPAYTIRQAREAMFFIGVAALRRYNGNMDTALYYLYNSDLLSRTINRDGPQDWWVTDAELYMGEAYDIKGDRKDAVLMYQRVLNLPNHNSDHTEATRYIAAPYRR